MAIIDRKKKLMQDERQKQKREQLEALDQILKRQVIIKRGMSMMYVVSDENKAFMTRGKHSEQVAEIGGYLANILGGDEVIAKRIGIAHDFGHSVLAHNGETGIGRFLASPEEFQETETKDIKLGDLTVKDLFDHSKHGRKILELTCSRQGIEIPDYLLNGIESHSSGSNSKGAVKCESFEAECIMRADKIASSISDTQDMLNAGVFDLSDKSLGEIFDKNEEIRQTIEKRVFGDYRNDEKEFDIMLDNIIKQGGERAEELRKIKDNPQKGNSKRVYEIFDEVRAEQIDKQIEIIKEFIKLEPEEQRIRMINLIVDGVKRKGVKVNVTPMNDYSKTFPEGQLFITRDAEGILAGLRGLLISCENKRILGKMGCELDGLVETCARYVYKNQKDFEHNWPFKNWRKDKDNKKIEWKDQVAYGIAQMTDRQFKDFCEKLLEREDAREAFKNCKYRDPRDTEYMKKNKKELPFSTYDFSTKENIEKAFIVDLNRTYQEPMYIQLAEKKREISGPER